MIASVRLMVKSTLAKVNDADADARVFRGCRYYISAIVRDTVGETISPFHLSIHGESLIDCGQILSRGDTDLDQFDRANPRSRITRRRRGRRWKQRAGGREIDGDEGGSPSPRFQRDG